MLKNVWFVLFVSFFSSIGWSLERKVPKDWLVLPENIKITKPTFPTEQQKEKTLLDLRQHLSEIYSSNRTALDNAIKDKKLSPESWRLFSFISDLGVMADDMIGVLAFEGEAAATMYWRRKDVGKSLDQMKHQSSIIQIQSQMTDQQIRRQLEPAIRVALATKRIKDEKALRKNLFEFAKSLQYVSGTELLESSWPLDKFRLDVSVGGSGSVGLTSVGGEVRLRMEWINQGQKKFDLKVSERREGVLKTYEITLKNLFN